MCSSRFLIATSVSAFLVLLTIGCGNADDEANGETAVEMSEETVYQYRLVRLRIPSDSQHRRDPDISPRSLYVILEEDGEETEESTKVDGWEAEFPRDDEQNTWTMRPDASYTVQVWHSKWLGDVLLFSKSGLDYTDFESQITETLGTHDPPERAAVLEFEQIK